MRTGIFAHMQDCRGPMWVRYISTEQGYMYAALFNYCRCPWPFYPHFMQSHDGRPAQPFSDCCDVTRFKMASSSCHKELKLDPQGPGEWPYPVHVTHECPSYTTNHPSTTELLKNNYQFMQAQQIHLWSSLLLFLTYFQNIVKYTHMNVSCIIGLLQKCLCWVSKRSLMR